MSESDVRGRGARCSPPKVKAAIVPRPAGNSPSSAGRPYCHAAAGRVLLFSAKALLERRRLGQWISGADQPAAGVRSVPRRPSFLPGKRRLAGLTPEHPLPISCEWRGCRGVLCGKRMVCFCANQFLLRFRTFNTGAPLWRRKQRKRKRRRRSNSALGRRNFKCDARDRRLDMSSRLLLARYAFLRRSRIIHSGRFRPDPPDFRFVLGADNRTGRRRIAAPFGAPICAPRTGCIHAINSPRHG